MITILAPAKINLTLEVLGKRPDGFHEIRSVIQAISLCDTLDFKPGRQVTFTSDLPAWSAEESLVSKAVALLQQSTGCSKGANIQVDKRIPIMAGLGGDSSDAAAVLLGLNKLWELNLPVEKLLVFARQLGSDVSLFFYGGTALLEGRGEIVTPLPSLPHTWVVLAMPPAPPLPGKTGRLYQSLSANHFTDGSITEQLVDELKTGSPVSPSMLFNTFENVAFALFPGLGAAREHFIKLGATDVHLAGSGPALFSLVSDKVQAEELYSMLHGQNMSPFLAETMSASL